MLQGRRLKKKKCVVKQSWSFEGKSESEILKAPEGELISPAGRIVLFTQLPPELLTHQRANVTRWQLYWIIWRFKASPCDFWLKSLPQNGVADSPRTPPCRKSKIVLAALSHSSMCCQIWQILPLWTSRVEPNPQSACLVVKDPCWSENNQNQAPVLSVRRQKKKKTHLHVFICICG